MTLITTQNLGVSYGKKPIFEGINLSIESGKTYVLLGPSGCGKTTLLYALTGLLPAQAHVSGTLTHKDSLYDAIILQDYGLFPWKTVLENTLLPYALKGISTQDKGIGILESLGLKDHLHHFPKALSGGQKQRVAIARALVQEPDCLFLDEPFSALDALTRESLQEDLKGLALSEGLTYFLVTHSIEEAVFLGETILIMNPMGQIAGQIDNSLFQAENLRENPDFYALCIKVRKTLEEVSR